MSKKNPRPCTEVKHPKQWFIDRIGKRVHRSASSCRCKVCKMVEKKGLVIADHLQAIYLFDCQNELDLFYFDKTEINENL